HGRIDGAVNCVGSALLMKPVHLTTDDEWAAALAANLTSAFLTVRAAVRAMTPAGGSVVLVSSAAARLGVPHHEAIAAAQPGGQGPAGRGGLGPTAEPRERRRARFGAGSVDRRDHRERRLPEGVHGAPRTRADRRARRRGVGDRVAPRPDVGHWAGAGHRRWARHRALASLTAHSRKKRPAGFSVSSCHAKPMASRRARSSSRSAGGTSRPHSTRPKAAP